MNATKEIFEWSFARSRQRLWRTLYGVDSSWTTRQSPTNRHKNLSEFFEGRSGPFVALNVAPTMPYFLRQSKNTL
jgi:hypothetical protein